jgi:hypothetical protein
MATSASTDYSVTRDNVIYRALRVLGVTSQGETPTATQVTEAAIAFNGLTKALAADGMPLWGIKESQITLVASTRSYRIGTGQTVNIAKPLRTINAFYRNTTSEVDTPLVIITRDEYNRLSSKFVEGTPSQVYFDVQRTYTDMFVYPVPTTAFAAANTLFITYQRTLDDVDAASDEPDFPMEWFDALTFLLADRLSPEYGVNEEHRMDVQKRAMQYKMEALSFGTEYGSLYFSLDRNR